MEGCFGRIEGNGINKVKEQGIGLERREGVKKGFFFFLEIRFRFKEKEFLFFLNWVVIKK